MSAYVPVPIHLNEIQSPSDNLRMYTSKEITVAIPMHNGVCKLAIIGSNRYLHAHAFVAREWRELDEIVNIVSHCRCGCDKHRRDDLAIDPLSAGIAQMACDAVDGLANGVKMMEIMHDPRFIQIASALIRMLADPL